MSFRVNKRYAYIREYTEYHPICEVCQPNLDPIIDPSIHPFDKREDAQIVLKEHLSSARHKEALRLKRTNL